MRNRIWLMGLAVVIGLLLSASTAQAGANACFAWSCSEQGNCQFNSSCSSGTPYIWKYGWEFGDGATIGMTGSTVVSHDYGPSGVAYPFVTLHVLSWSGDYDSVTCDIIARTVIGPALPQEGTCS